MFLFQVRTMISFGFYGVDLVTWVNINTVNCIEDLFIYFFVYFLKPDIKLYPASQTPNILQAYPIA